MSDEPDDDRDFDPPEHRDVGEGGGEIEFGDEDDDEGGASALDRLFAADGAPDLEEGLFAGPVYWPSVPAADIEQEFRELRVWVQELVERFEHLDHKVIPGCWWRHNGHVEALQALRDHERMSYTESSPGQAATSWHREFQFIEARLREWTAYLGCDQDHKPPTRRPQLVDEEAWEAHVRAERQRRQARELSA